MSNIETYNIGGVEIAARSLTQAKIAAKHLNKIGESETAIKAQAVKINRFAGLQQDEINALIKLIEQSILVDLELVGDDIQAIYKKLKEVQIEK